MFSSAINLPLQSITIASSPANMGMETTTMKLQNKIVKLGDTLTYNDGRKGHTDSKCKVIEVFTNGIRVQFEDRFAPTTILGFETAWTNFLTINK